MVEKIIRYLQRITRTKLIYSSTKWKGYITANLWAYVTRLTNETINNSPSAQDSVRRTPKTIFSKKCEHKCKALQTIWLLNFRIRLSFTIKHSIPEIDRKGKGRHLYGKISII